ncbi:Nuclear inhibitor of protein phosphatase 1 [Portunus trituberculatus]|uniref:Nuclear inhibitor of protein phosphatase 1 n=1 Tax=Portunus trituberculatus TaxID=210409 RepID=A0A5B7ECZ0_PORTR|nr:Nuclear inhibitor of protein phosphatase 1 [Portunus trituberculatus]
MDNLSARFLQRKTSAKIREQMPRYLPLKRKVVGSQKYRSRKEFPEFTSERLYVSVNYCGKNTIEEFNTAHNRRISMLGIGEDDPKQRGLKRHKFNVSFKDEEDVINPEDVDPSVGRFRNLVQTTVVPSKKRRLDISGLVSNSVARDADGSVKNQMPFPRSDGLYGDLPPEQHGHGGSHHSMFSSLLSSKLGMPLPNPAPETLCLISVRSMSQCPARHSGEE